MTSGTLAHDACPFFEMDYKCMLSLASCSEGIRASLLCISAWQDSTHRRRLGTWCGASLCPSFVAVSGECP